MSDTPDYVDSMGRLLNFAARAVTALSTEILAEHGLTMPQWIMLTALWRNDGMTVTELARYSKSTVPAASRLLGRMEEQGLVKRRSRPGDRRSVQVWLTRTSSSMSQLMDLYEGVNEKVLEGFSEPERKRTAAYLNRILANASRHYAAHRSDDPLLGE